MSLKVSTEENQVKIVDSLFINFENSPLTLSSKSSSDSFKESRSVVMHNELYEELFLLYPNSTPTITV